MFGLEGNDRLAHEALAVHMESLRSRASQPPISGKRLQARAASAVVRPLAVLVVLATGGGTALLPVAILELPSK